MRKIIIILSLMLSLSIYGQTLSEIANVMNSVLPKEEGFFRFDHCNFSKNTFSIDLTINAGMQMDMSRFKEKPQQAKEWFKIWSMYLYKAYPHLFKRVIEKNVDYKININDISNNVSFSVLLSPADIKNAINKYGKLEETELAMINQSTSMNIQTPVQIDEVTIVEGVSLTKTAYSIKYTILDSDLDMSVLEEYLKENKAAVLNSFQSGISYQAVVDALVKSNRSLILTYTGKNSRKVLSLTYSPRELSY